MSRDPVRVCAVDRVPSRVDAAVREFGRIVGTESKATFRTWMAPADAMDGWSVGAPYHAIMVWPALPAIVCAEADLLLAQLRYGGKMVAPVRGLDPGDVGRLVLFEKGQAPGAALATPLEHIIPECSVIQPGVKVEHESSAAEEAHKAREARAHELKQALEEWREAFAKAHDGRRPTRHDMFADARAKALFEEFSKVSRL